MFNQDLLTSVDIVNKIDQLCLNEKNIKTRHNRPRSIIKENVRDNECPFLRCFAAVGEILIMGSFDSEIGNYRKELFHFVTTPSVRWVMQEFLL